ncbi:MAG: hypothetical protein Q4A39_04260, partial [Eubacteriales bacterium]|nr:hypothetical protein [Eubacteriales bacterium]
TYSVSVRYYDEDGKEIMRRRYPVRTESGDMASVLALLNDPEAIMDRVSVGLPVTEEYIHNAYVSYYEPETMLYTELSLTPEQAVELYEDCILPDCREGNLGRAWIGRDDRYYAEYCANSIGIELLSPTKDPEGDYYPSDSFGINVEMTAKRTVNWLKAHGIPVLTQGELYVHQLSEYPVYSGAPEVSVYSAG